MQAAADESDAECDSLRLAVLAALNIADELFRCREPANGARVSPTAGSSSGCWIERGSSARSSASARPRVRSWPLRPAAGSD